MELSTRNREKKNKVCSTEVTNEAVDLTKIDLSKKPATEKGVDNEPLEQSGVKAEIDPLLGALVQG